MRKSQTYLLAATGLSLLVGTLVLMDADRTLANSLQPLIGRPNDTNAAAAPGRATVKGASLISRLRGTVGGLRSARKQTPTSVQIERLSAYSTQASQDITISFRIVNVGAAITTPFRTSIFPGTVGPQGLEPGYVTTPTLGAGETVYVSRTMTLPANAGEFDVRVQPDVDAVLAAGPGPIVAIGIIGPIFPPIPGQWVSIGPRRITSPAVPALGLGTFDATGRLGPIAVHPLNPQIIYVGSPGELGHEGCGVWRTLNGGISWHPITDSFPTLAVAAIAIDPINPDRVYVVTVDDGLFRSDDGGTSWSHVFKNDLHVRRNLSADWTVLLISQRDPSVLYLTTDLGVLRSADGGANWTTSLNGPATALVMDPRDPNVLYAGIQGQGVYRTTNGGICGNACWSLESIPASNLSPPSGILLALSHPASGSPETVYALLGAPFSPDGFSLFRRDADAAWGQTFSCDPTPSGNIRRPKYYREGRAIDCSFQVLAADPATPDTVYLMGPSFYVSGDGGVDFIRTPPPGHEDRQPEAPHGDFHGFAFDPTNSHVVFAATDGGIYRSSDRGFTGTWTFIGEGITNTEIYDLAHASTFSKRIIAGTQDNGTILYEGSPTWDHIYPSPSPPPPLASCEGCGGDGATVAIDPANADTLYSMGQYQHSLIRSDDGGGSFVDFFSGLPQGKLCATFNATFHFHTGPPVAPPNSPILLASCFSLWRTTAAAANGSWNAIFSPATGRVVRSAIDASLLLYYAGASDGRLYAGPFGANWQEVFNHPASLSVSDIEVDSARPDTVYVSFAPGPALNRSCTGVAGRIYRLRRLSSTPSSATTIAVDITGNLPGGLCVNALAIDPHLPRTIYAATSKGVYRSRPPAGNNLSRSFAPAWVWEEYMNGMPPADVRDLEVVPAGNRMRAATYGRGAFEVIILGLQRWP